MVELDLSESKIARAREVLCKIESPTFSGKELLRLDLENLTPSKYLENYARVGRIKEKLKANLAANLYASQILPTDNQIKQKLNKLERLNPRVREEVRKIIDRLSEMEQFETGENFSAPLVNAYFHGVQIFHFEEAVRRNLLPNKGNQGRNLAIHTAEEVAFVAYFRDHLKDFDKSYAKDLKEIISEEIAIKRSSNS